MAANRTGIREQYKEVVNRIYAEGTGAATARHIAEETGKLPQAVNRAVKLMAKDGEVTLLSSMKGHASFVLPNNVLLPPEALVKRRRTIASMADADDLFVLQRFCDYLFEFIRRDLTMDHVRGYIQKQNERSE